MVLICEGLPLRPGFDELCRHHGIAATHPRRIIYDVVVGHMGHPTPEEVCEEVRRRVPSVSLATVYNNLKLFEQMGLIREVGPPGAKSARYDANLSGHQHLVCIRCKRMVDVFVSGLERLHLPEDQARGFEIRGSKVYFEGLCQDCQRSSPEGPAAATMQSEAAAPAEEFGP
jgi:Fur family peroxide stress response transcriptional regulator